MARPKRPGPSERQLEILAYVIRHVELKGFQPTRQEIADHFDISKSAVVYHIRKLIEYGLVENGGRHERSLKIKGVAYLAMSARRGQDEQTP